MASGYDSTIVNGEPTRCFLGAGLSEDPNVRGFRVEAGGSDIYPFYRIPTGPCRIGSDDRTIRDRRRRLDRRAGQCAANASIMPHLISSNTEAKTIKMAAKAANRICAAQKR